MKAMARLFLWVGVGLLMTGCITSYSPSNDAPIEIAPGASQTFKAVSDDASAVLVWYLDGKRVAKKRSRYTVRADRLEGTEDSVHVLEVREENSKYQIFYEYLGLPDDFAVSVKWTIKVKSDGTTTICYLDEDIDGFGDINKKVELSPGEDAPDNCIDDNTDCNDGDAGINPGAAEICGNDVDENCDGEDESCVVDEDGDGYSPPEDCDDTNPAINPGAEEICGNDVDENCDGEDESCVVDEDGDGYSPPEDCDDANPDINPGAEEICGNDVDENCDGEAESCVVDEDGDGYSPPEDCDDANPDINPGAAEVCGNDVDENCDGEAAVCIIDEDADGYSPPEDCDDNNPNINPGATEICGNDIDENCDGNADPCDEDGDGYSPPEDCDDNNPNINPGAAEICGNDIDENCDGEADPCDEDGDGYSPPEDCDDNNPDINPGAEEICGNDIDENCDGEAEPCDEDGDGYSPPEDCDDNNPDVNPGAAEICGNDIDENCDGEAEPCDADGDGYSPPEDCDDNNPDVNPGAEEICGNDIDENCDGEICAGPPETVTGVNATDIDSGQTDVTVTWDAVDNATHYNVYRAVFEEDENDSEYTMVGENITDTTFTHVEDFQADVLDKSDPIPALAPDASYEDAAAFLDKLKALDTAIRPLLYSFKAPSFYKVEACNDEGCSELSAADAGQAEFIHTAEFSEVAMVAIMGWGNGSLYILADAPPGADGLSWCGYDACGSGGGTVMGRIDAGGLPMVDVFYNNYTEIWDAYPELATFTTNGWLGGEQGLMDSLKGVLNLSGDIDFVINGTLTGSLFMFMHKGGSVDESYGYVSVTYKGETYQFTLPVSDPDDDGIANDVEPTVEDDEANRVSKRDTGDPVPFTTTPPTGGCLTLKADPVDQCMLDYEEVAP